MRKEICSGHKNSVKTNQRSRNRMRRLLSDGDKIVRLHTGRPPVRYEAKQYFRPFACDKEIAEDEGRMLRRTKNISEDGADDCGGDDDDDNCCGQFSEKGSTGSIEKRRKFDHQNVRVQHEPDFELIASMSLSYDTEFAALPVAAFTSSSASPLSDISTSVLYTNKSSYSSSSETANNMKHISSQVATKQKETMKRASLISEKCPGGIEQPPSSVNLKKAVRKNNAPPQVVAKKKEETEESMRRRSSSRTASLTPFTL